MRNLHHKDLAVSLQNTAAPLRTRESELLTAKMTATTDVSPRLTAVAQTAMLVAAARLAEARHDNPVLKDELLEVMIGSSKEVIAAVNQCIEETQQQQRGRL